MPGQPRDGNLLRVQRSPECQVIPKNRGPGDEDAGRGETDEPPKDGQSPLGQAHEAQRHEDAEEGNADPGRAPARSAQEHLGRVAPRGETIQHAGAGEQRLVRGGPGGCDDDAVDDRGDERNAYGRGSDDERGLGGAGGRVGKAGVVARDQQADDEDGEHVEDEDAQEDALAGGRDRLLRVPRLRGRHGDGLGAGKGKDGARHDAPVTQEATPAALGDEVNKRARLPPVPEAEGLGTGDGADVDGQAQEDEADDQGDLEPGEGVLDLAKDADPRHADGQGDGDEDDYEHGGAQMLGPAPEPEEHAHGRDLPRYAQDVAVDEVPAQGHAPGGIDQQIRVGHEPSRKRPEGRRLGQGELHGADEHADGRVAQEGAKRPGPEHRGPESQEQPRPYGSRDAQHGEVALAKAAVEVGVNTLRLYLLHVVRRRRPCRWARKERSTLDIVM